MLRPARCRPPNGRRLRVAACLVEELAREFANAGMEHEIAGLDAAAGEAQAAVGAMARFAVGGANWQVGRQRLVTRAWRPVVRRASHLQYTKQYT
jgi:hypothetical protein